MPTIIRVWSRVRSGHARRWEEDMARDYLYGGQARGAQVSAWKFSARAEAAGQGGASYAASLLDLDKAFDRIPHHRLVEAARQWGYPLQLLRLSLKSYRLARIVGVGGVYSAPLLPTRSMTAGSVFATRELRALLIGIFDQSYRMFPMIEQTLYVDDATIECIGTQQVVEQTVLGATRFICQALTDVGLKLSTVKNVLLASSAKLGKSLQDGLAE